jgi:hypothetical protein
MALILAIEPDRRQAAQLSTVVRRRVKAELILVDTTERALDAIGNRMPDLMLVPALLSPQDDAALAAALRVIAATARVQMLTIPVLGSPRPAERSVGGVLAAFRRGRKPAGPDGCDPNVFAEQIVSYLAHAAEERADGAEFAPLAPAEPVVPVADRVSFADGVTAQEPYEPQALHVTAEEPDERIEAVEPADASGAAEAPLVIEVAPGAMVEPVSATFPADDGALLGAGGPSNAFDTTGLAEPVERDAPADALGPIAWSEPALPANDIAPPEAEMFEALEAGESDEGVALAVEEAVRALLAEPASETDPASQYEPPSDYQPPSEHEPPSEYEPAAELLPVSAHGQFVESREAFVSEPSAGALDEADEPAADQGPAAELPAPRAVEPLHAAPAVPVAANTFDAAVEALVAALDAKPLAALDVNGYGWLPPAEEPDSVLVEVRTVIEAPEVEDEDAVAEVKRPVVVSARFGGERPAAAERKPVAVATLPPPARADRKPAERTRTEPAPAAPPARADRKPAERTRTEAAPVAPPAASRNEREWVALIESLRHDVERLRAERAETPAQRTPPARPAKPKKAKKPVQDEWGFFDPEQCGFAALLAKLDEVTECEEGVGSR